MGGQKSDVSVVGKRQVQGQWNPLVREFLDPLDGQIVNSLGEGAGKRSLSRKGLRHEMLLLV